MKTQYQNSVIKIALIILALGFYALFQVIPKTEIIAKAADDPTTNMESVQTQDFDQKAALAKLQEEIKGKENDPAGTVFKNIQIFKNMPAGRLLKVMELGYARSLGVNCTHCHTPEKWESEDKPAKQIAREMAAMTGNINTQLLKNIKNLSSPNPVVNCTTCHRGQVIPALNLPAPNPASTPSSK